MAPRSSRPRRTGTTRRHWIFDRRSASGCARALREAIEEFGDDRRWAVAENWAMDHRVSRERESGDLRKHLRGISGPDDWWECRTNYFAEELCRSSLPGPIDEGSAYVRAANLSNRLTRIAGFDRLVHVGSLNGMLWWLSQPDRLSGWRKIQKELLRVSGFRWPHRPPGASPDWFDQQIDQLALALQSRGEDAVREVAGFLVNAFGDTEPPWWACFSAEIQEALRAEQAHEICMALGLGHRRPGEWLLLWDYTVAEAQPLYRPTVLEANNSPFHFPSVPGYSFGITMPLREDIRACREVLHAPLRGSLAANRCTGRLLRLAIFSSPGDNRRLAALRSFHLERLRREFMASGVPSWLRRHPPRSI
jgi:hypothetical protein